ncbi:MAG TPA: hypothetical protein VGV37_07395 [Aliidongia sp.]|uniref:hypothetical protein n=1 Tax=Aliidongia sp. TaxID=1914230 RepID=UPI002DDD99F1|nr:hypothetical protein [Aliidongia sp.]HEV2674351.1 hypothetical protein [Aliidongia sp.]
MNAQETEYQSISVTVSNCEAVQSKSVFAFVDVEMMIAGVSFRIKGVQARHLAGGGTSIHLPTYRTPAGTWRAAIDLPPELREVLSEAVLDHLLDEGVVIRKAG